jgi:hypothetical protein
MLKKKERSQKLTRSLLKCAIKYFGKDKLHIFADNCDQETIDAIKQLGGLPMIINLGGL